MSPRRHRPVTVVQTIGITLGVLALAAGLVGVSYLLQLPRGTTPPLPPPELGSTIQRAPGEVVCPRRGELRARPTPMPVTSAELVECPDLFDGEVVAYTGEAVGTVLLRRDHGWVHVNDDAYAHHLGPLSRHRTVSGGNSGMAVSMPRDAAATVTPGGNRVHGTMLEIVGTFHRDHAEDAGAPGIAAQSVRVTRDPQRFTIDVSTPRVVTAAILAPLTLVLAGLLARRRGF